MSQDYTAAGGLVIDEARLLLLARPGRDELRLPKGHVEPGETLEAAALREVTEETGMAELAIESPLGVQLVAFGWKGAWIRRTEHWYLMRLLGPARLERPPADDAQFELRWMPLAEAERALSYAAERNLVRKAMARLV